MKARRAAHEEVRLEALSRCHGARGSCRGRREVASVVRIGLVQIRGQSCVEAGRICDPVEILVAGRAHNLQDTTGHMFLEQVINRVSCFLHVDAASMLTDQVHEHFAGREGLTKLCSMVRLRDMKKIDLVFMQRVAVCSWLMTVDQSRYIEQVTTEVLGIVLDCRSYPWTVLAAVAVDHAAADVRLAS